MSKRFTKPLYKLEITCKLYFEGLFLKLNCKIKSFLNRFSKCEKKLPKIQVKTIKLTVIVISKELNLVL